MKIESVVNLPPEQVQPLPQASENISKVIKMDIYLTKMHCFTLDSLY